MTVDRATQAPRAMKVASVRLGADLWALLDAEAARAGVSISLARQADDGPAGD